MNAISYMLAAGHTAAADPLADVGQLIWEHGLRHAYAPDAAVHALLPLALPVAALAAACVVGLALFRRSKACADLVRKNPKTYRRVHGPHLVPLAVLAGSAALMLGAPHFPEETAYRTITACLAAGLGAGLLMLYRAGRDGKAHEKGSAAWAKWKAVMLHPTYRWLLPIRVSYRGALKAWGSEAGKTVLAPSNETACRHLLLVGQTGSGKGLTVFSHLIGSGRVPFIYQDLKGQAPGQDSVQAQFGKAPILWGCAAQGGHPSMRWNPLEECRQDARPSDAFGALAAALIPGRADSDWVAELARPILAHSLEHGGYRTLGAVQDALKAEGMDAMLAAARVPQGLMAALDGKYVREYLGTAIYAALAPFERGWGREVTSGHDFTLADACRTCTYVLSAEPEATRRTPITMFWSLLLRRLLQSAEPVPLTLLFDEALAAGKIPNIRDALVTLRDRQVSIVFGVQHLSGLREVYGPNEGDAIIDSFGSRIVLLNGLDPRDREWLVKRLGQRTIREKRNKSVTTTAIPLMTLDDLGRRASSEGVFWAVIDGPGMTRTGEPIIARMVGGPKDLVRPPHVGAVPASLSTPLPSTGVDLDEL